MIKEKQIMKKIFMLPLMLLALLSLTACSPATNEPVIPETPEQPGSGDSEEPTAPTPGSNRQYLVLFTSRSGNTEEIAHEIRTQLDCDMLEVEPETAYEEEYNAMLERAREELEAIQQGQYPAIKTFMDDFDNYDLIFVGYPIWHGSMATTMQSFLHAHSSKLAGKRIALFATSGSSGITTSVREAEELCPGSEILEHTLLLISSSLSQAGSRVTSWLEQLNIHTENNDDMENNTIRLTVNGTSFTATLIENPSTNALKERLAQGSISIRMNDYGNMEKVGSLGFSLPRNDSQTTTGPGDLVLYQGNSLVIFYGSNSWSYTRLGRVDGVSTREEMLDLLGGTGDVTVILSLD